MGNKEIKIIMASGRTEAEAKKHLKNGTSIYRESEKAEFIQNCIGGMTEENEAEEDWNRLEKVECDGEQYRIDFVL